jgi:hypothetical protein
MLRHLPSSDSSEEEKKSGATNKKEGQLAVKVSWRKVPRIKKSNPRI